MANEQMASVFAEFGKLKELPPESPDAQMAVKKTARPHQPVLLRL